jgi:hypothetical protein
MQSSTAPLVLIRIIGFKNEILCEISLTLSNLNLKWNTVNRNNNSLSQQ